MYYSYLLYHYQYIASKASYTFIVPRNKNVKYNTYKGEAICNSYKNIRSFVLSINDVLFFVNISCAEPSDAY
jgi:hypothetical protein